MENADPQRLQGRVILHEHQEAERRARALKAEGHQEDAFQKAQDALGRIQVQGFLQDAALLQVDLAAHGQDDARAHRSDAQAAHLDEGRQDQLPDKGEGVACIRRDQAGDADRAGGGVQGVDVGHIHAFLYAERHDEQHRPQQDHQRKAQGNDPHRRLLFDELKHKISLLAAAARRGRPRHLRLGTGRAGRFVQKTDLPGHPIV